MSLLYQLLLEVTTYVLDSIHSVCEFITSILVLAVLPILDIFIFVFKLVSKILLIVCIFSHFISVLHLLIQLIILLLVYHILIIFIQFDLIAILFWQVVFFVFLHMHAHFFLDDLLLGHFVHFIYSLLLNLEFFFL